MKVCPEVEDSFTKLMNNDRISRKHIKGNQGIVRIFEDIEDYISR
jgi:hypothetical protein